MSRNSFLKFLGSDYIVWANKYKIEPVKHPCSDCGKESITNIPIAKGELRGLIAEDCSCGNNKMHYCFVRDPAKGDILE